VKGDCHDMLFASIGNMPAASSVRCAAEWRAERVRGVEEEGLMSAARAAGIVTASATTVTIAAEANSGWRLIVLTAKTRSCCITWTPPGAHLDLTR
jgi:hypothetical protein